jgi:hypothetical protein
MKQSKTLLLIAIASLAMTIGCGKAEQTAAGTDFASGTVVPTTQFDQNIASPTLTPTSTLPIYDPASTLSPIAPLVPGAIPFVDPLFSAPQQIAPTTYVPILPQQTLGPDLFQGLGSIIPSGGLFNGGLFGGGGHCGGC